MIRIYVPDIECSNCSKEIEAKLNSFGTKKISFGKDFVDVESNKNSKEIIRIINDLGFRAALSPFAKYGFKERCLEFLSDKKKYDIEYRMIKYMLYSLFSLLVIQSILYFTFNLPTIFLQWIFYTDLAVVSICGAFWHFMSYRGKIASMTGMMIGMIFGMQTGMMIGIILGATNGLFLGSVVSMVLALLFGIYSGRCCGAVGILQGSMAGVMGAVMGAMTGVMFLADKINYFMPIFMIVNIAIMQGLSYYLFEEIVENNQTINKVNIEFSKLLFYVFIISTILVLIILFGFRSGLSLAIFG